VRVLVRVVVEFPSKNTIERATGTLRGIIINTWVKIPLEWNFHNNVPVCSQLPPKAGLYVGREL
jgi:hypothetical protein